MASVHTFEVFVRADPPHPSVHTGEVIVKAQLAANQLTKVRTGEVFVTSGVSGNQQLLVPHGGSYIAALGAYRPVGGQWVDY